MDRQTVTQAPTVRSSNACQSPKILEAVNCLPSASFCTARTTSSARFVSKAKRHIEQKRLDGGFLHFVIALDLVFGETDAANKSVSRRVAVSTHEAHGRPFTQQAEVVKRVYDARSRYVHHGNAVRTELIDDAADLCDEVLTVLLRLHGKGDALEVSKWLAQLDLFSSTIAAGRPVDQDDMSKYGLFTS